MRSIRVEVPAGHGQQVAEVAFGLGVSEVVLQSAQQLKPQGVVEERDIVDVTLSVPEARAFTEAVQEAPFFSRECCTIQFKERRGVLSRRSPAELTWPLIVPCVELQEELWKHVHPTPGLLVRLLLAGLLLGHGMMENKVLVMASGLLFMPMQATLLAAGYGAAHRCWSLARRGLVTFALAVATLVASGLLVGCASRGPVLFDDFSSAGTAFALSLVVGLAAALAESDDTGRRELIGLAASSQTALVPVWLGLGLVLGLPDLALVASRLASFGVSAVAIALASGVTFWCVNRCQGRNWTPLPDRTGSLAVSST